MYKQDNSKVYLYMQAPTMTDDTVHYTSLISVHGKYGKCTCTLCCLIHTCCYYTCLVLNQILKAVLPQWVSDPLMYRGG